MSDDKQKIDTPSSFWGIGGMTLTLLSLATMLLMIFAGGAVIGGLIVGLLGMTAGLVCMGIGIYKNNATLKNICKPNNITEQNAEKQIVEELEENIGTYAEKQQIQGQNHSQSNDIHAGNACISKKMVDYLKSTMLNK